MYVIGQLILLLILILILVPAVYASYTAAPFIQTKKGDIDRIIKLARFKKNDLFLELGAGSGRVMLAIAQNHPEIEVSGIEIHPFLWLIIRIKILINGLDSRVKVNRDTFYRQNLADADVIYCFLMPKPMEKLKEKFKRECKKGTKIISRAFPIPGWQPQQISTVDNELPIYLYLVK